jgi:hypothetical protein
MKKLGPPVSGWPCCPTGEAIGGVMYRYCGPDCPQFQVANPSTHAIHVARLKLAYESARRQLSSCEQNRLDCQAGAEGQGDDRARGSDLAQAVDDEEDGW